ncbi:hypothetical protein FTX61_04620 [Nitriliruptoraceae bacterium ZYF776]|nr:hypothetical protein [Profundirhabdus halotolerans]
MLGSQPRRAARGRQRHPVVLPGAVGVRGSAALIGAGRAHAAEDVHASRPPWTPPQARTVTRRWDEVCRTG